MAFFNKKQEVDPTEKAKQIIQRYDLQNVDPQYADALKSISTLLIGSGIEEFSGLLNSDDKAINRVQTQYIHAIMEQNFIIIRQLNDLINLMKQK